MDFLLVSLTFWILNQGDFTVHLYSSCFLDYMSAKREFFSAQIIEGRIYRMCLNLVTFVKQS